MADVTDGAACDIHRKEFGTWPFVCNVIRQFFAHLGDDTGQLLRQYPEAGGAVRGGHDLSQKVLAASFKARRRCRLLGILGTVS
jgi:hypothetical protein